MRVPDPFGIRAKATEQIFLLSEAIYSVATEYYSVASLATEEFSDDNTYFISAFFKGFEKDDLLRYLDLSDPTVLEPSDNPMQLSFTVKAKNAPKAVERIMWSMFNKDEGKDHVKDDIHTIVLNVVRRDKLELEKDDED